MFWLLPPWDHVILLQSMRLLSRATLREFWRKHKDAERPLKAWANEVEKAQWYDPEELKALYASASFVGNDRVVFNIGGNKYRVIVMIKFANLKLKRNGVVFVRFIGTHSEYDKIDATKV